MTILNLFNCFTEDVAEKVHNLQSDTIKMMLTNTAPVATNTVPADITEIANGNGYTTGGITISVSSSAQSSGVYTLKLTNPAGWTASGAGIGPWRYLVLYNSTANKLIGWYDYGSAQTAAAAEQILPTFDATNGVLKLSV